MGSPAQQDNFQKESLLHASSEGFRSLGELQREHSFYKLVIYLRNPCVRAPQVLQREIDKPTLKACLPQSSSRDSSLSQGTSETRFPTKMKDSSRSLCIRAPPRGFLSLQELRGSLLIKRNYLLKESFLQTLSKGIPLSGGASQRGFLIKFIDLPMESFSHTPSKQIPPFLEELQRQTASLTHIISAGNPCISPPLKDSSSWRSFRETIPNRNV